jgi:hypothetical protein
VHFKDSIGNTTLPDGARQILADEAASVSPSGWTLGDTRRRINSAGCALVCGWTCDHPSLWDTCRATLSTVGGKKVPTLWRWRGDDPRTSRQRLTAAGLAKMMNQTGRPGWCRALELSEPHPLQPVRQNDQVVLPMFSDPATGQFSLWPDAYFAAMPAMVSKLTEAMGGADGWQNIQTVVIDNEWRGDPRRITDSRYNWGANPVETILADARLEHELEDMGITRQECENLFTITKNTPNSLDTYLPYHRWVAYWLERKRIWMQRVNAGFPSRTSILSLTSAAHCNSILPAYPPSDPYYPQIGCGEEGYQQAVKAYGFDPRGFGGVPKDAPLTPWRRAWGDARRIIAGLRAHDGQMHTVLQANHTDPVCGDRNWWFGASGRGLMQFAARVGRVIVSQKMIAAADTDDTVQYHRSYLERLAIALGGYWWQRGVSAPRLARTKR